MNNLIKAVSEKNGQAVTTSRKVAKVFGKRHDSVLRDVRNLDCSDSFFTHNFVEKK